MKHRCIAAHTRKQEQNLFAIIQGGLDVSEGGLRDQCLREMIARDTPGYAIGGLAGGEDKESFWRVVAHCTAALPAHKPRYLMGVGIRWICWCVCVWGLICLTACFQREQPGGNYVVVVVLLIFCCYCCGV